MGSNQCFCRCLVGPNLYAVDCLNGRNRRDLREIVQEGLDKTSTVIANTIKLTNDCAPAERQYVDRQLNPIHFNLLKTLVGVEGRNTLIYKDLKMSGNYWKNVVANVKAEGLTTLYFDDQKLEGKNLSQELFDDVATFISDE